jgi:hypothetical protein
MRKAILITSLALATISCCKSLPAPPMNKCIDACLVSYKYRADSSFIKTDTIWRDKNLCGRWVDSVRRWIGKDQWIDFRHCPAPIPSMPDFRLERRSYKILNQY